jgi:phospholipase C
VKFLIPALALASVFAALPVRAADDVGQPAAAESAAVEPDGAIPFGPRAKIKHVVILFQENRTPDNLFHGLAGADIATHGINSKGKTILLQKVGLKANYGLGHSRTQFLQQFDNGKLDGADLVNVNCNDPKDPTCPPKNPQFRYVDPKDVEPYFHMAKQYVFGDRMFQSNQGASFPSHQYLIAGTSTPGGVYADKLASSNPRDPTGPVGCLDGPPGQHVSLVDAQGVEDMQGIFPCFEHQTMMDLLDNAGLSWSYYAPNLNGIFAGPNVIRHLRTGPDWAKVKTPQTLVLTDIANGTLSDVSWVTPSGAESDHPGGNDGTGPAWISSIVNAIGNSPYWADTAIFITWDDWGGWYDHVLPPVYSKNEAGFRVPLLVISPYAKQGYVSHVTYTLGSILKFIEVTYNLPSLGYLDQGADSMLDCFAFAKPPRAFKTIPAPLDAAFFIKRAQTEPQTDPDDD